MNTIKTSKPHPRARETYVVRNTRSKVTSPPTKRFLMIYEKALRSHGWWNSGDVKLTHDQALTIGWWMSAMYAIPCRIQNEWTITIG